jgi:uncharacterized protein YcbK (DUF882 family)
MEVMDRRRRSGTDPVSLAPRARRPGWPRSGLTARQERAFDWLARVVVIAMGAAWGLSAMEAYSPRVLGAPPSAPTPARAVESSLLDPRARDTAYLSDQLVVPLRGQSGKLRAAFRTPGAPLGSAEPPEEAAAHFESEQGRSVVSQEFKAPTDPGMYKLAVEFGKARQPIEDLRVITLVPFSEKKNERIGLYYLGRWPYESGGRPRSPAYVNPLGFVEVTPENRHTLVSEHFALGDFLTKDQFDVWPKYVVLDPRLPDKLELTIQELRSEGVRVEHMQIMSGFRTPHYNVSGGNTAGRANLSRHMFGDAADVFVDNDRNGTMDDLNGDGRVDTRDSEVIAAAVESVEAQHPALAGGVGIYKACCGHGPFTHIDVRGYRARWRGEGAG